MTSTEVTPTQLQVSGESSDPEVITISGLESNLSSPRCSLPLGPNGICRVMPEEKKPLNLRRAEPMVAMLKGPHAGVDDVDFCRRVREVAKSFGECQANSISRELQDYVGALMKMQKKRMPYRKRSPQVRTQPLIPNPNP